MYVEPPLSSSLCSSKQMEIRWQTGKVAMVLWLQGFNSNQRQDQTPLPHTQHWFLTFLPKLCLVSDPQSSSPAASTSPVLRLQACATGPGFMV